MFIGEWVVGSRDGWSEGVGVFRVQGFVKFRGGEVF